MPRTKRAEDVEQQRTDDEDQQQGPPSPAPPGARKQVTYQEKWVAPVGGASQPFLPPGAAGPRYYPTSGGGGAPDEYDKFQRQMDMLGEGKIVYSVSVRQPNGEWLGLQDLSPHEIEDDNIESTIRKLFGGGSFKITWNDPDGEGLRTKLLNIAGPSKWEKATRPQLDPLEALASGQAISSNDILKLMIIKDRERDERRADELASEAREAKKLNQELMVNLTKMFSGGQQQNNIPQRDPLEVSLKMFDIFANQLARIQATPAQVQGMNWEKLAGIGLRVLDYIPNLVSGIRESSSDKPTWERVADMFLRDGIPAIRDMVVATAQKNAAAGGQQFQQRETVPIGRIPQPPPGMTNDLGQPHSHVQQQNDEAKAKAEVRQQFERMLLPQLKGAAEKGEEPYDWAEGIRKSNPNSTFATMMSILDLPDVGAFYERYPETATSKENKEWFDDLFMYLQNPTLKPEEENEPEAARTS